MKFSTFTSTLLCIFLLGIQDVSQSQYYGQSDSVESSQTDLQTRTDQGRHYSNRNLHPEFRGHQHQSEPYHGQTVSYFGTTRRNGGTFAENGYYGVRENQEGAPSEAFESYRRRPVSRTPSENPINGFNMPFVGISFDAEGMELYTSNPEHPNLRSNILRIRNMNTNRRAPGYNEDTGSTVERPPTTMVIIHRPTCPQTQRLYKKDGNCYNLGGLGHPPCGPLMSFYSIPGDNIYGDCDCARHNGAVSRPLVYWRPKDRCYLLFHQGPCGYREWLILDSSNRPHCAPRSCPDDPDGHNEDNPYFWFRFQGRCYKTGQHYGTFCSSGQEEMKVYFPVGSNEPNCMHSKPPLDRALLSSVSDLPCKSGHKYKKTQNGECKRVAHYSNDYDYY